MKSLLLSVCFLIACMPAFASSAGRENGFLFAAIILAILTMIISLSYLKLYLLSLFEKFISLPDEDLDM